MSFRTVSEDSECECLSGRHTLVMEGSDLEFPCLASGRRDEHFERRIRDVHVVELDREEILAGLRHFVVHVAVAVL